MRKTILIIDDDDNDVLLVERTLRKLDPDLRVEAVLSGEAGLSFLGNERELPALVLLDLKMTGISGFDTLRSIRTNEHLKNVPVVVLTSSDLQSDLERAHEAGAVKVVQKSIGDKFRRDLESVLGQLPW